MKDSLLHAYVVKTSNLVSSQKTANMLKFVLLEQPDYLCNMSKTSASVSSGVPNTDKQAECFYCFEVFGTPDETRSTNF